MQTIARQAISVNRAGDLTVANAQLYARRQQWRRQRVNDATSQDAGHRPLPTDLDGDEVASPRPARGVIALTIIAEDGANDDKTKTVAAHPSLLTAFLRNEMAAIGRIWLLCRHLDAQGRGCLTVDELRAQLTRKTSPLHVCGWRRLRQILQKGKNIFWERDHLGRLWLYSTTRVAKNLDLTHFSGDSVQLPISDLLGTIGTVRATFYTAFHCGRNASPISRATLHNVTGVPTRTQRHYDNKHNTDRIKNYTFIANVDEQNCVWQHGRAAFNFTDKVGKHGTVGKRYTAIRLPNSYQTTRYARLDGKRKRLNQKLKQDLVHHGTQGNSQHSVRRLFFADGQGAARAFNRNRDVYLRAQQNSDAIFWISWLHHVSDKTEMCVWGFANPQTSGEVVMI